MNELIADSQLKLATKNQKGILSHLIFNNPNLRFQFS
jgi:hypothetical protein